MFLEFALEPLEQRNSVGSRTREARDNLVVIKAPSLARRVLHHVIAHGHLAIGDEYSLGLLTHKEHGRPVHQCASLSISHLPIILHTAKRLSSRHFQTAGTPKKGPDWRPAPCSGIWGLREIIAAIALMRCSHRQVFCPAIFYQRSSVAAPAGYRPGFAAARSTPFAGVLSGRQAHVRSDPAHGQHILAENRCPVVPRQSSFPRHRWFSGAPIHPGQS